MEIKKVLFILLNGLFLLGSVYISYLLFIRRLIKRSKVDGGPRLRPITAVMIISILVLVLPVVQVIFSYALWGAVMGAMEAHNALEGLAYMLMDTFVLTFLTIRAYRKIR